jgi:hypothetical protein
VHDLQRARRRPHGVAEGGHVDAQELELRGQVGAREGSPATKQPVRDHLGHRVAGRDQSVAGALDRGHLPDRPDVLSRSPARRVGDQATALANCQSGRATQRVSGSDTRREHHEVGEEGGPVGQLDAESAVLLPVDRLCSCAGVDLHPQIPDEPLEDDTTTRVDLERHEPRGELHDVRREAQLSQGVGRLESQQPTADHEPIGLPALDGCACDDRVG